MLFRSKKDDLKKDAWISVVKDSWLYNESRSWGAPLKGFQGENFFSTPNPKIGAVFTYYLREDLKTMKEKRKDVEKEKIKKGEPVYYPSADSIRMEDNYPDPYLLFYIMDDGGNIVRKLKAAAKKGISRITWDLRYNSPGQINFKVPDPSNPYDVAENGHLSLPGNYKVSLAKFEDGKITELVPSQSFKVNSLNAASLPATDKKALADFCKKVSEIRRAVAGSDSFLEELTSNIKFIKQAIFEAPSAMPDAAFQVNNLEKRLANINIKLNGDASLARREFETPTSISSRINSMESTLWGTSAAPTQTFIQSYETASKQFSLLLEELNNVNVDIKKMEDQLEQNKAPYTPGRLPVWKDK